MKPVTRDAAEIAILDRFLVAYQKRFGIHFTGIIHRDKPDFEVENLTSHEKLGIEVTGVYQNEQEAKIQYSVVKNWHHFEGSIEELLRNLNRRLEDKSEKSKAYGFSGRVVLAIWLGSLVFDQKIDVDFIRQQIVIPDNKFSEIWLIVRDKDDYSPEIYPLQV